MHRSEPRGIQREREYLKTQHNAKDHTVSCKLWSCVLKVLCAVAHALGTLRPLFCYKMLQRDHKMETCTVCQTAKWMTVRIAVHLNGERNICGHYLHKNLVTIKDTT